jgi:hypothetical protein
MPVQTRHILESSIERVSAPAGLRKKGTFELGKRSNLPVARSSTAGIAESSQQSTNL